MIIKYHQLQLVIISYDWLPSFAISYHQLLSVTIHAEKTCIVTYIIQMVASANPLKTQHLSQYSVRNDTELCPIVVKPRHCFAWRGFLLCVCLSVCVSVCVCVSVTKISQKILNRSTSFLAGAFPLTQGGNHSILRKIASG